MAFSSCLFQFPIRFSDSILFVLFSTDNSSIAEWMSAPSTQYQLEFIRPDFLLIRTVAKGLIMWSDIVPTAQWVEGHVPQSFLRYCMVREIIYLVVTVSVSP